MLNILILSSVVLVASLLIWPRVANARLWRATVTPLASIIGSGFLVLGPILDVSFGAYAPLAMLGLCIVAWGFGDAIRFNILDLDRRPDRGRPVAQLEALASASLAFAFFVSVAYYLNLFGAFGVSLTSVDDSYHARLLTTSMFVLILVVGWTRGFSALERMEQVTVGLKLSIIAGLIVGLAIFFGNKAGEGTLQFKQASVTGIKAVLLLAGLIVTVQGFETSRYLGTTYDAATRVRSMRWAQIIASLIYLVYIGLLSYSIDAGGITLNETAIIDLMSVVAPILPLLLVAAALSAQFSAAVADTSGSGGLISEISRGRVPEKLGYALLVSVGLLLTWSLDIFQIISYASRAFALYYAIQAGIAAHAAFSTERPLRGAIYLVLCALALAITGFGTSVE
ncbi:hypothetical protein CLV78_11371 [Aliiruegeria haliotis]|uniref:Uncharacterized protein n=1 Tax=Aliiruegeria haliotis TaxID=1280846 RepID=A0A2T0RH65_9RHOB|nr:hypothetical protein [Aliiruegeria haliotis]PRY20472.1 hypothetical protein CLV78_11371 [Aliiruegeria haliotis]